MTPEQHADLMLDLARKSARTHLGVLCRGAEELAQEFWRELERFDASPEAERLARCQHAALRWVANAFADLLDYERLRAAEAAVEALRQKGGGKDEAA